MNYKTIAIVDDHLLIAEALSNLISKFRQFKVLYICENGKEFQQKLNSNPIPDIVLLDISMPIMNGFETSLWLKDNHPDMLILVLSMENDDKSLIGMVRNGAKGFLLKNSNIEEFNEALNTIIAGKFYFPEWATNKIINSVGKDLINLESKYKFSEREKEFLKYVATDLTYKEIADKMYCSPRTIENYRDQLFEKLELKSRVMLAVFAIKNGFAK